MDTKLIAISSVLGLLLLITLIWKYITWRKSNNNPLFNVV